MDPDVVLRDLRRLTAEAEVVRKAHQIPSSGCIDGIIEKFQALDEWLAKGGFPPRRWSGVDG